MEKIQRQVAHASRFLFIRRLLMCITWMLSAGLAVAAIGLTIPKLWPLEFLATAEASETWNIAWIAGGALAGLVCASLYAWWTRENRLTAAIEIDRRFGLKERLSSALTLTPEETNTRAGQALFADAERAADRLDVRDQFSYGLSWRNLAPIVPAIAICLLVFFVDNAVSQPETESEVDKVAQRKRIEAANDALRKKLDEEIKKAEDLGLEEAEVALREIDRLMDDERERGRESKEDALVRLNDAKSKIEERVKQIGDADAMRKQLAQMSEPKSGPADEVTDAIKDGDLERAAEAMDDLAKKLEDGELDQQEKEELADQLDDIKNQLEDAAREQEQNEEILREQIQQAKSEGDLQKAGELQDALEQLEQAQPQVDQMNEMADSLAEASESLRESSSDTSNSQSTAQAQQALQEASEQLEQIEADLQEMESLESLLEQIAESKQMMNQDETQQAESSESQLSQEGEQMAAQQGSPQEGQQPGQQPGQPGGDQMAQSGSGQPNPSGGQGDSQQGDPSQGNGSGNGRGDRGENENPTELADQRVDANPQTGQAVVTGTAGGENLRSQSRSEVIKEVQALLNTESDPIEDQTIPRRQQDHAREYFQKFSKQK